MWKDRQVDGPCRHWGRWNLSSTSPVTTRAVILTTFRFSGPTTMMMMMKEIENNNGNDSYDNVNNNKENKIDTIKMIIIIKEMRMTKAMITGYPVLYNKQFSCIFTSVERNTDLCFLSFSDKTNYQGIPIFCTGLNLWESFYWETYSFVGCYRIHLKTFLVVFL